LMIRWAPDREARSMTTPKIAHRIQNDFMSTFPYMARGPTSCA
jgi:hypothetical protein